MLSLAIVDSEIELVPVEIAGHPAIKRRARRRGRDPREMLLDSNLDHVAMRELEEGNRRGRPDIAHVCLLVALDSILSREGELQIHVHTRDDVVLSFDPSTRVPRVQARFYGILRQILVRDRGTRLIRCRRMSLSDLHSDISPDRTVVLTRSGEISEIGEHVSPADHLLALVGGFPSGYFRSPVDEISDAKISCHPDSLDAWTVVSEVICSYRNSR